MTKESLIRSSASVVVLMFLLPVSVLSRDTDGQSVIRRVDRLMRGEKNSHTVLEMKVHRPRWDRELKMEGWETRGGDSSFIRILSPPSDAGTGFLKNGNTLRQYIPRINRTIRISKSMMLTSWMGSDFSNDDLVRASSMADDYEHSDPKDATCDAKPGCWEIVLTAKKDAPVVWPKIVTLIRKDFVPVSYVYYNLRDEPLKRMEFDDVKTVQGRLFPHRWVMKNLKEPANSTEILVRSIQFDIALPASVFTERNLTRGR